jgi:hypothetical protein
MTDPLNTPRRVPAGRRRGSRAPAWSGAALLVVTACGVGERQGDVPGYLPVEEIARYGSVHDDGASFTSISGVAVGDSAIFVLETEPPRVAVLGHDGAWLRDMGRAGEGPGELVGPTWISLIGDTVWVRDPAGRRLEAFAKDGRPVASYRWTIAPDSLGAPLHPAAPLADGTILGGPGVLNISRAASGRTTHRTYRRASRSGHALDHLYREELRADDFMQARIGTGRFALGLHPLRRSPLVAPYPDGSGLVVVERPEPASGEEAYFDVRIIGPDGTPELDLAVAYLPIPADGWRDAYTRTLEEEQIEQSGSVDRDFIDGIREALTERRFHPSVTGLEAGSDGSIWIRREEASTDSVRWEVFSRAGTLRGAIRLPVDVDLLLVSLDEIWAVEKDALDVPFLVRMRVGT